MFKSFLPVIFVCLFASDVALSQTALKQLEKQDLETLLKPYASLKSLETEFTQKKHLADLNLSLTSSGHLKVDKPTSVLWTVDKPSYLEVEIKGDELSMTTIKDGRKDTQKISLKQMGSQQGAKGLTLLVPWLEMDIDKLMSEYSIFEIKPSHLRFTPAADAKNKPIFRDIELKLASNKHIKTLTFNEQNGDSIEITFKAAKIEKQ